MLPQFVEHCGLQLQSEMRYFVISKCPFINIIDITLNQEMYSAQPQTPTSIEIGEMEILATKCVAL